MRVVDRKRLLNAVKFEKKNVCENFSWGSQFQVNFPVPSPLIKSFYVNEIGADVSVPVSYQDLKTLKRIAEHASRTQGLDIMNSSSCTLHINETKIKTMSGSFVNSAAPILISIVTENLLGFKIDSPTKVVDIHLCKLVIIKCGEHAKLHSESEKKSGTFGVIVLTIPVEGGYSGGRIQVEHEGYKRRFHFEQDSQHHFSLVAFLEDCHHELEPISDGWMLTMVFHLIWKDALALDTAPLEFPAFIKAFTEINEELVSWSSPSSYKKNHTKEETSKCLAEISHSETPCKKENINLSVSGEQFTNMPNDSEPIDDATTNQSYNNNLQTTGMVNPVEEERFFFFPLQEKYDNGISFAQLRGRDRLMSHIFQSISTLDVHLAIISQLVDDGLDHCIDWELTTNWTKRNFQIKKWIRSDESLPFSEQLKLNATTQLVGNIEYCYTCEINDPKIEVDQKMYYHSALIIQPRVQSIRFSCGYQLDAVLDYMEEKLPRILEFSTNVHSRQQLVFTLNQVISFAMQEPLLVWTDPCPATNQRTSRLLELCLKLNAKQEGLDLLESIGTDISINSTKTECPPSGIPNIFLEGIRDQRVARAIADFESKVIGWSTCGDAIMKLITPLHIFRRLDCFSHLGLNFFENQSLEGARAVADRISTIVNKLQHINLLKDYHISHFFYLVVTMETNPLTADRERIEKFFVLFRKLGVYRQCVLIIDFQTNHNFYLMLKEIPSCQILFRQLYEMIVSSDLHSCSSMLDVAASLLNIIVDFGDEDLLRMLIDNLSLAPVSKDVFCGNNILDSILLSPDILDLACFSELGKRSILNLLDFRIKQLLEVGFLSEMDSSIDANMEHHADNRIIYHNSAFGATLASYIYLVLRMETTDLADSHIVMLIGLIVFNLTFERLCNLILDVRKLVVLNLHLHPRANELFVELCRMLFQFDRECAAKVSSQKMIEVLKCFVWLQSRDLVQSFVHQIFLDESNSDRFNPVVRNIIAEIILSAPDLIGRLIPEYFSFTTITLDALFEAWVTNICNDLDLAPDFLHEKIYANVNKCVQLYIINEKQCPHSSTLDLFSPLFLKLSSDNSASLSLMLAGLLVKIHKEDANEESVLKESTTCLDLIRKIAMQFVSRDLTDLLKSASEEILNCLVDVMISLLWLGDQHCLLPFVDHICSTFQKWQENPLVSKIVTSSKALEMAITSRYSRESFCRILEQRINRLKMIKAKESTGSSSSSEQENNARLFSSSQIQLNEIRSLHRCFIEQLKSEVYIDENLEKME